MPPAQILIVEDERIIAAELTRRISRLGYEVIATAGSGQRRSSERGRVALILSSWTSAYLGR